MANLATRVQSEGESAAAGGQGSILLSTFYVNGVLFALDTAVVEEVVRLRRTTRVAHSPAYFLGIMNLRGKLISVLDLAQILRVGRCQITADSRLYIVPDHDGAAGLAVDQAADVVELDAVELEPPPSSMPPSESRFVRGVARAQGRLVTVLDPAAILSAEAV